MTAANEIRSLLKEAQLYQDQGLLKEARKRYEHAAELVEGDDTIPNKPQLLSGIRKKIESLEAVAYRVEKKTHITEISPRDKDLIKRLFSNMATDDKDTAMMEGAVALAKFGQFDRAISEFEDLLENSPLRIVAAKHILRCHMALRALHDPLTQFQKWVTTGYFGKEELSELSTFLERTYGLSIADPGADAAPQPMSTPPPAAAPSSVEDSGQPPAPAAYDPYEDEYVDVLGNLDGAGGKKREKESDYINVTAAPKKKETFRYQEVAGSDDDYIDYISSVGIPLKNGQMETLPVNLQTGSVINLIVPAANKAVMACMGKGVQIGNVQLNSPISANTGLCMVASVARIDMGPRKGDYSVDLKIEA